MEPSKMFGSNEECHSCESGWTMYIGSPIQGGDDGDNDDSGDGRSSEANDGGHGDETDGNREDDDDDEEEEAGAESDDSMASDASSGPSHILGDCYLDKKLANKKSSMEKKQKLGGLKKKEDKEQQNTCKAKETRTTPSPSVSKGTLKHVSA